MMTCQDAWKREVARLVQGLDALSPLAVLHRGYALVRSDGKVLREAQSVVAGDQIDIHLGEGSLSASVEEVFPDRSVIYSGTDHKRSKR